ncbi:MAG: hypothetical protein ABIG11_00575, partial [bacterium]
GATWSATRAVRLARRLSLVPSGFYSETVNFSQLNEDEVTKSHRWRGRYGGGANLRYDTLLGSLDLGYSYARRLKANTFSDDLKAADRGEETNFISIENFLRPNRLIFARLTSGYDLRNNPAYHPPTKERVAPFVGEMGYTPRPELNVFFRNEYSLTEGNRAFIGQADIGDPKGRHMGLGVAHYISTPSDYIINQTIGWKPAAGSWRMDIALLYTAVNEGGTRFRCVRLFGKSVTLYKDFHDFRTMWYFSVRPGVRDFSFKIDLKMREPGKRKAQNPESDSTWHPWRKEGDVRD